jgi:hypothetical protein
MVNNEPDLKELVNSFVIINRLNIPRLNILNLQLYVEHYVNEIVATQIGTPAQEEVKKYITFPQKLRILKNMKILDEKQLKILEILNKIRDEMVHELVLNPESIDTKLKFIKFDFVYGWAFTNKEGEVVKKIIELKKIFKKIDNNLQKLSISTIIIIGLLYNAYKKMKNEEVSQFVDIIFDEHQKLKLIVRNI